MKKLKLFFMVLVLLTITASTNTSCTDLTCSGKGTLELTNNSLSTVQQIWINGVNYGSLDPGEKQAIELSPGTYAWQLKPLAGGTGCSPAVVTITECDTQGFKCSGK